MFVGPPFHSTPFSQDINYLHASVVFNITNTGDWLKEAPDWTVSHIGKAREPQDATWWLPDTDLSSVAIKARLAPARMSACPAMRAIIARSKLNLCLYAVPCHAVYSLSFWPLQLRVTERLSLSPPSPPSSITVLQ